MKKRQYKRPIITVARIKPCIMLCTSGVGSNKNTGFGGRDENGTITPATRKDELLWNDESNWSNWKMNDMNNFD